MVNREAECVNMLFITYELERLHDKSANHKLGSDRPIRHEDP